MSQVFWNPGVTIYDMERMVIYAALRFYNDNKTHAANALGITVRTLHNKISQYEIEEVARVKLAEQKEAERKLKFPQLYPELPVPQHQERHEGKNASTDKK